MADDDWLSAATEETPAAPEQAPAAEKSEPPTAEFDEPPTRRYVDKSDVPIICKYWKRPVFLQYSYIYDYRHNYYDDVIDYLDRRQRGIRRDIPRPQTWAERSLRTYTSKARQSDAYRKREKDINLLSDMRTCARFYNYHSTDYNSTRYPSFLY